MNKQNNFWNLRRGESNVLEIMHEISNYRWDGETNSPDELREDLSRCEGDIDVIINSNGGDTFAGADMYTALREYSKNRGTVRCWVTGIAASSASIIAMAGDEVHVSPVGMIMIHDPWTGIVGNSDELREMADVLDTVKAAILEAYVAKTGLDRETISQMMSEERWMPAAEAVELGFADSIDIFTAPIPVAASDDKPEPIAEGALSYMRGIASRMQDNMVKAAAPAHHDDDQLERARLALRMSCI